MTKKYWLNLFLVAITSGILGYFFSIHIDDLFHILGLAPKVIKSNASNNNSNGNGNSNANNKKNEDASNVQSEKPIKKKIYRCPMHPHIVSEQPGKCPICHMDLQLVDDEGENNTESDKKNSIEGRSEFELSEERQQLIGVTYGEVSKQKLTKTVKATGKVAFDPELFTAIEEYRQAFSSWKQVQSSSVPEMKKQTLDLLQSSRTRLRLMGLSEDKIDKLKQSNDSSLNLLLPQGKAWIYAEVFEYEMNGIKVGQKIQATAPSHLKTVFEGTISSISPVLNNPTRTIRVRAEVPDPKGLLRPDTFMNVSIAINFGEKLAVPEDAVLFSEGEAFVFLVKDKGRFIPKKITIGEKTADFYEVVDGLNEGDKIVTSANFLIDSESKLKSVLNRALKNKEKNE